MLDCPFYRLICSKRKKKCRGYFEGWTDAQLAEVARYVNSFDMDKIEVTEEGAKMFERMGVFARDAKDSD